MIPRDTALVGFLVMVGCAVCAWGLRRRPHRARLVLVTAALVYLALVTVVAFFPLPIQTSLIEYERSAPQESPWAILVPLQSVPETLGYTWEIAAVQLGGNILLFVPFGYMAPLLCRSRRGAFSIMILAFSVSVALEGMQLALSALYGYPYRLASVDDVLFNVLGAGIGYLVYRSTRHIVDPVSGTPTPGATGSSG